MSAIPENRAAIINDDENAQDIWRLHVEEAGYDAYIVKRPRGRAFASIDELAAEVEKHARFAVFDHRLAPRDFAQFSGAAIVAALYDRRTTAPLLVSTYERQDADTTIRLHRRKVPVLLSNSEFGNDPETIRACFDLCASEIWKQQLPLARRTLRTIVAIEYRTSEADLDVVDALVPGWNTEDRVRFPVDLIAPSIRHRAQVGQRFFALVNTGAQRDEDLFFSDFELAPEPDPNDGLG